MKLAGFDSTFRQHRENLHFLLGVHASGQIQKIDQAVQRIINTLGQPITPKEVQATQIMQRSGGELATIEVRTHLVMFCGVVAISPD